ncbi:glycosyl transferase [Cytophagales bacterium LB-30]|uniref:Glycosyl transferase n=1 Tax=Shiella aurantiaca TaxID=3058365 RepID=A0ABT8F3C5_9BACT|nr:glycosyltransferase [Shiella aurantiaca]MDN4164915.1 glycosyl transferase [Shiella aurantiaca]
MKKVLLITYYWPPSGGVGVQRWLKFIKYLPEFGWEPMVYTPENPDFSIRDEQLLQEVSPDLEVLKLPIWEPFSLFNQLTGNKNKDNIKQGVVLEKAKMGWKEKLSIWIRGNIFIPDPRVFWLRPSVRFLEDIIQSNGIQAVITTGPPHSMHLIGRALKRRTGVVWLADFRDPWSEWDLLDKLFVGKLARGIHQRLERSVLKEADAVSTVTKQLTEALQKLGGKRVDHLTNGVDIDGIQDSIQRVDSPEKFSICYFGLLNEMRNPPELWEAIEELLKENPEWKKDWSLLIGGIVSESILARLQQSDTLRTVLDYRGYMAHSEVMQESAKSAIQLLLLNNTENARWIIPVKLYEYLATGRPILMLGPEASDAGDVLRNLDAGQVIARGQKETLKKYLSQCYQNYLSGNLPAKSFDLTPYSRKHTTRQLAELLDNLIHE